MKCENMQHSLIFEELKSNFLACERQMYQNKAVMQEKVENELMKEICRTQSVLILSCFSSFLFFFTFSI